MSQDTAVRPSAAWVPPNTFGARLALLRQAMGWNVKEAARECGLGDQSWRNWEMGGHAPRDYEAVVTKIAERTGVDVRWLAFGQRPDGEKCWESSDLDGPRGWRPGDPERREAVAA